MAVKSVKQTREQNVEIVAFRTNTMKHMDTNIVKGNVFQVHKSAVRMLQSSRWEPQLTKVLQTVAGKITTLVGKNAG